MSTAEASTQTAKLILDGQEYDLPVTVGSEGEHGIDIGKLRALTGAVTLDPGYGNTGSCRSTITFIDGEKGILQYRGYPIEEVAEKLQFLEVAYLLLYGHLPKKDEYEAFVKRVNRHTLLHEEMKNFYAGYPRRGHPMAILASLVSSLATFHPSPSEEEIERNIIRLIAKLPTIAAFSYKMSVGQPFIYPRNDLAYCENFLHMMFALPVEPYVVSPTLRKALNLLLILHADHEQNCSTATVRGVGSSQANLFASVSAGIDALWGPLHGGANQRVIEMLRMIVEDPDASAKSVVKRAKDPNDPFRLMGFGHRVYKNYDPRARVLRTYADEVLGSMGITDPLLDVAKELEQAALDDPYFADRKLYPNVDFYSGLIFRALKFPTRMFTVLFAIGRLPGWMAQWKEMTEDPETRIMRPRQIYTGEIDKEFIPIGQR